MSVEADMEKIREALRDGAGTSSDGLLEALSALDRIQAQLEAQTERLIRETARAERFREAEAERDAAVEALRGLRYHKTDCWCLLGDDQHDVACRAAQSVLAEQEKKQQR